MRAWCLVALLTAGCLSVPPDRVADDDGPGGGGGAGGDAGTSTPGDGADSGGGADRCVPGTELDLVWVNEVAFDVLAADQVTLPGLMILVNAGPDRLELGSFTVTPPGASGAVQADFTLLGSELSLPPGEAMGALNTAASDALTEFDEEWTNLHVPQLDAVFAFDGSGDDAEVPLQLDIGGYEFDLSITVLHDPISTGFDWVRDVRRTTAFCDG